MLRLQPRLPLPVANAAAGSQLGANIRTAPSVPCSPRWARWYRNNPSLGREERPQPLTEGEATSVMLSAGSTAGEVTEGPATATSSTALQAVQRGKRPRPAINPKGSPTWIGPGPMRRAWPNEVDLVGYPPLRALRDQMSSITKQVTLGKLPEQSLLRVAELWTLYQRGPYRPFESGPMSCAVVAFTRLGLHMTSLALYGAFPQVRWKTDVNKAVKESAHKLGDHETLAAVLRAQEARGSPVTPSDVEMYAVTCIRGGELMRAREAVAQLESLPGYAVTSKVLLEIAMAAVAAGDSERAARACAQAVPSLAAELEQTVRNASSASEAQPCAQALADARKMAYSAKYFTDTKDPFGNARGSITSRTVHRNQAIVTAKSSWVDIMSTTLMQAIGAGDAPSAFIAFRSLMAIGYTPPIKLATTALGCARARGQPALAELAVVALAAFGRPMDARCYKYLLGSYLRGSDLCGALRVMQLAHHFGPVSCSSVGDLLTKENFDGLMSVVACTAAEMHAARSNNSLVQGSAQGLDGSGFGAGAGAGGDGGQELLVDSELDSPAQAQSLGRAADAGAPAAAAVAGTGGTDAGAGAGAVELTSETSASAGGSDSALETTTTTAVTSEVDGSGSSSSSSSSSPAAVPGAIDVSGGRSNLSFVFPTARRNKAALYRLIAGTIEEAAAEEVAAAAEAAAAAAAAANGSVGPAALASAIKAASTAAASAASGGAGLAASERDAAYIMYCWTAASEEAASLGPDWPFHLLAHWEAVASNVAGRVMPPRLPELTANLRPRRVSAAALEQAEPPAPRSFFSRMTLDTWFAPGVAPSQEQVLARLHPARLRHVLPPAQLRIHGTPLTEGPAASLDVERASFSSLLSELRDRNGVTAAAAAMRAVDLLPEVRGLARTAVNTPRVPLDSAGTATSSTAAATAAGAEAEPAAAKTRRPAGAYLSDSDGDSGSDSDSDSPRVRDRDRQRDRDRDRSTTKRAKAMTGASSDEDASQQAVYEACLAPSAIAGEALLSALARARTARFVAPIARGMLSRLGWEPQPSAFGLAMEPSLHPPWTSAGDAQLLAMGLSITGIAPSGRVYGNLAIVLARTGRLDRAISALKRALSAGEPPPTEALLAVVRALVLSASNGLPAHAAAGNADPEASAAAAGAGTDREGHAQWVTSPAARVLRPAAAAAAAARIEDLLLLVRDNVQAWHVRRAEFDAAAAGKSTAGAALADPVRVTRPLEKFDIIALARRAAAEEAREAREANQSSDKDGERDREREREDEAEAEAAALAAAATASASSSAASSASPEPATVPLLRLSEIYSWASNFLYCAQLAARSLRVPVAGMPPPPLTDKQREVARYNEVLAAGPVATHRMRHTSRAQRMAVSHSAAAAAAAAAGGGDGPGASPYGSAPYR